MEQLMPSSDDNVRTTAVRAITKTGRPGTVRSPVQKLFPLEVQDGVMMNSLLSTGDRKEPYGLDVRQL